MALPATGQISIADVVVYRRAAGTSAPWAINQNSGFNNMNSYRGSAWVNPASWDASISNTAYDSCYAPASTNITYIVTNTTSLFGSAGNVYSVQITANSGYNRTEKGCVVNGNAGASSTYVFQNAPAGTYKVGLRVNPASSGDFMNSFVGNTSNASAYGTLGASVSEGSKDTLITFTIASTTDIRIRCSVTPPFSPFSNYNAVTYARIFKVS